MADDLTPSLAAVVARIEAPEVNAVELPPDATGELGTLLGWWRGLAGEHAVVTARIEAVGDGDVIASVEQGVAAADRAIDAGATLLVPEVADRDDEAARTVIALLTRREASAVVDQPEGMTDRTWMARCAGVRDRAAAVTDLRGEPIALLAALPAPGLAFVAGVLLGAAARRTPCLVDGTDELAAALVADRLSFRAKGWWRAGSDSPDPGRAAALARIDLTPGLPLALTDDAGWGAEATLALLARITSDVRP